VLTADLVNARRRGQELQLITPDQATLDETLRLAKEFLTLAREHQGQTREDLNNAFREVSVEARHERLKAGLIKLVLDQCVFEAEPDVDPIELRQRVFLAATKARKESNDTNVFDRAQVLGPLARELGMDQEALLRAMYADLKDNHRLETAPTMGPRTLADAHRAGQAQAVLLRATRVIIDIDKTAPAAARAFFSRLKFLQLLHQIDRTEAGGFRITVEGPLSMFDGGTRYGLKLAMLVPMLEQTERWSLAAEIRWGKDRKPLSFRMQGDPEHARPAQDTPLPDDVTALLEGFRKLASPWFASPCQQLFEVKGLGLVIPDLEVVRGTKRAFIEVLGHWSRDAVFRRIEMVRKGLPAPVLFAVGAHLRVSEQLLDDVLPGSLYVYKRTMSARAICAKLDALTGP